MAEPTLKDVMKALAALDTKVTALDKVEKDVAALKGRSAPRPVRQTRSPRGR